MAFRVSYVGEPVTAAGLTLGGVRCLQPDADATAVWRAILDARNGADLVLIDQDRASAVRERLGALTQSSPVPPMLLIPSIERDDQPSRDTIALARRVLGLD